MCSSDLVAPLFFDLLTSAPVLFANFSLAVDAAFNQLIIPPSFSDITNQEIITAERTLSEDFVALAIGSCGIALSGGLVANANDLFSFLLPAFVIYSQECDLLNVTIIEQAVDAADVFSNALENSINAVVSINLLLGQILIAGVNNIASSTPGDMRTAAAQALRDDFLFFVNDFCDIPPLSNTTLTRLDDYILVDIVNAATERDPR